ncbi:hypothetical protein StoSoilB5_11080 [Arthrobacter sp. StoSoilB5]|nr:hypothetical protein StoSoilB5_11080 [Arthrobacter sp. StoSoilB5]
MSGRVSPAIILSVVDFPDPFGPMNPVIVPGAQLKLKSWTAFMFPKDFEMLSSLRVIISR